MIKHFVKHQLDIISEEPWFGDGFQSKISQLTDEEAFTKPLPQLHSVAELISHATEWKREGIRQLQGLHLQLTMDSPDNWKSNEALQKTGWKKLKAGYYAAVEELIKILETKDDTFLEQQTADKRYNNRFLLEGLLDHDVYHLGQIAITIKFLK